MWGGRKIISAFYVLIYKLKSENCGGHIYSVFFTLLPLNTCQIFINWKPYVLSELCPTLCCSITQNPNKIYNMIQYESV